MSVLTVLKHDYEGHDPLPLIYEIHNYSLPARFSYKAKTKEITDSAEADSLRPVSLLALGSL
jgi:hypothetical protein